MAKKPVAKPKAPGKKPKDRAAAGKRPDSERRVRQQEKDGQGIEGAPVDPESRPLGHEKYCPGVGVFG